MKKLLLSFVMLICSISTYAQLPNTLSATDKVYGLSKFWQEVNYNFVYLDKVDRAAWDHAYRELITKVQQTTNDYDYYRELQRFCAMLNDGHTNIYFPKEINELIYSDMFGKYRLFLTNIDGKAVVTRTNPSIKEEVPVGSEIIEVNGLPTAAYLKQHVVPYIASSTDYVLEDRAIETMLSGLEGETYQIKYRTPKGKVNELELKHEETAEEAVYPAVEKRELLDFKWLDKQTAYVALNSFGDPKIDSLFVAKLPEICKANALVVDLRYNGGGSTNIGRQILDYLTPDTLLYGSKNMSRLHIPSYKAWGRFTSEKDTINDEWATQALLSYQDKFYHTFNYSPVRNNVKSSEKVIVPTAILIGHRTASAAEDFLIYADKQQHMTKIGENSYGSTGQPLMFELPGGGMARICTKKDTYPDGREFVGYGVKPDIEVKMTLNDYIGKKDPVLARALQHLKRAKATSMNKR